jgi:hypothetical protein
VGDDAGAGTALLGLREALERERFAAPGSAAAVTPERGRELVSWSADVSAALTAHAPRRRRIASALLPASLLTPRRPARPLSVGRPA